MWIYDYQTLRFLAVNRAAAEKYKYTEAQFLEMTLYDIRPSDAHNLLDKKIAAISGATATQPSLWIHRDAAGYLFHVKITSTSLTYNGANARLVVITDVEDLVQKQQRIDELNAQLKASVSFSEAAFRNALKHSAIGMTVVSHDGRFLELNDAICSIYGYTREELLQLTFQDITYPDDLAKDLSLFKSLQAHEIDTYQIEKRYIHKNGSVVWALLTVSVSETVDPHPNRYVSQVIDITKSKEKKQQLQESLDIISKQNNRLYNFANIVSHNLRAHSNHLNLLVEMIQKTTREDKKAEYFTRLKRISGQLTETINNLADIVSIQNKEGKMRYMLPLRAYADRVVELLLPEIDDKHAQVDVAIDPDIEVYYNPAFLESILLNLLSNALKYGRTAVVPVITIAAGTERNNVVLEVADNGQGIDLDLVGDRLFGMYQTFHGNTDARGIGLFITKSQVEAMGGSIAVKSELNKGTTFTVHFTETIPEAVGSE